MPAVKQPGGEHRTTARQLCPPPLACAAMSRTQDMRSPSSMRGGTVTASCRPTEAHSTTHAHMHPGSDTLMAPCTTVAWQRAMHTSREARSQPREARPGQQRGSKKRLQEGCSPVPEWLQATRPAPTLRPGLCLLSMLRMAASRMMPVDRGRQWIQLSHRWPALFHRMLHWAAEQDGKISIAA
jgi:hypothetical protein